MTLTPAEDLSAAPPALAVERVQKAYGLGSARVPVLEGVSLTVQPGELCAIMGPSGVGKSTLLNLIAGLDTADDGRITVGPEDITALDDEGRTRLRRHGIGIIYQFFNLVAHLSARENVALPWLIEGVAVDDAAVDQVLDRVGMTHRAHHMPAQLSGGELQLISIARALARTPPLVLADEPTGNVNVATGRRIMALLRAVVAEAGSALLMVTHNPEDAALCDRVLFMRDGALVGEMRPPQSDELESGAPPATEALRQALAQHGI